MRRRLSYANLASTLALVVALGGGGAYAAGLAKNSVKSKQIKNGTIKTVDIKSGAIVGSLVPSDSLTGANIAEQSLGKVPSAASADTLGGLGAAAFQATTAHALINGSCVVVSQKGGVTASKPAGSTGRCIVSFATDGTNSSFAVSPSRLSGGGTTGQISVSLCGGPPSGIGCSDGTNTSKDVLVNVQDSSGTNADTAFYITKFD